MPLVMLGQGGGRAVCFTAMQYDGAKVTIALLSFKNHFKGVLFPHAPSSRQSAGGRYLS